MGLAKETPDQSVASKVTAALDKQAEIVAKLQATTGEDITEIRSALEDVQTELRSLTSDNAPNKIEGKESHASMIDDQVAGQFRSMTEQVQRMLDQLELATGRRGTEPANDIEKTFGEQMASVMLADDNVKRTLAVVAEGRGGWGVDLGGKDNPDAIPSIVQLQARAVSAARDVIGLGEAGALDPRFRRPEIVRHLREPTNVASLFRQVSIRNQRYEWGRQTFVGLHGSINAQVVGAYPIGTETAITVTDGSIFVPNSVVEFHTTAGVIAKFITVAGDVLTIFDVVGGAASGLGVALAGGEQVTSEMYKATAEEGLKPEGFDQYEEVVQFLIMLATHITTTEERLHFAPLFQSFLNGDMQEDHLRNVDWHTLYGTGTGLATDTELPGLANETGVQTLAWSVGQVNDTQADLILRGSDLIFSEDNAMLWAVMAREQWRNVTTLKGTDAHYISFRGPVMIVDEPGRRFVGPVAVRRSGKCRLADIFVVDPMHAAELVSGGNARMQMGHNSDDFRRNKIAMKYSESLLLAILSTTGYIVLDVDTQP